MSSYPVRSDHRFLRGTAGGRIRLGQIAWYEAAPAAGAVAAIHAAVTLAPDDPTLVTQGFTQPDVPRLLTVKGSAASVTGAVEITGADANNRAIRETVLLNGAAVVPTTRAFARVFTVQLPARAASGHTVSIGTANVVGLTHALAADVRLHTTVDGAADAGTLAIDASDVSKNLFTPAGALDGTKVLRILYVV
jgi:hypothetical protein